MPPLETRQNFYSQDFRVNMISNTRHKKSANKKITPITVQTKCEQVNTIQKSLQSPPQYYREVSYRLHSAHLSHFPPPTILPKAR